MSRNCCDGEYGINHLDPSHVQSIWQGQCWLGADIERKVWADGTFQTDQGIFWLKQHLSLTPPTPEPRPLYNDSEVLIELRQESGSLPSVQAIARRYVYPQEYVKEVLLPLLAQEHYAQPILRDHTVKK